MAVRVADTLKQQNDLKTFPVAFSEDIWIDQNKGEGDANYKDLQTLYNEGALGGSGLPEPETKDKVLLSTENAETSELEWSQVDKAKVVEIPLYETKEAAEADITNLTDGQIIATKDEGNENAKPVDVVEKGNLHAVTSNAVAAVTGSKIGFLSGTSSDIIESLSQVGIPNDYYAKTIKQFCDNIAIYNSGVNSLSIGGPAYGFLLWKHSNEYFVIDVLSYSDFSDNFVRVINANGTYNVYRYVR